MNAANLLVVVMVVMPVLVVVVMLPMPLVMVLVIFGFLKKRKGLDDLFMMLPLNSQGLLREAPIKFTMTKKMEFIVAIAK